MGMHLGDGPLHLDLPFLIASFNDPSERRHDFGVEMLATQREHLLESAVPFPCRLIGPCVGEGIPHVGDGSDPAFNRDVFPGEALGISPSVPPFMVSPSDRLGQL